MQPCCFLHRLMCHRISILEFFFVSFIALICLAPGWVKASAQQLSGNENQSISLPDAQKLVERFHSTLSSGGVKAQYFGRAGIMNILNQPNCIGLRIYYGMNSDGTPTLVLVGVDALGKELADGPLVDKPFPCPPFCDSSSVIGRLP